jgi:NAD(P)H-flavin reductase/ferredoxin
MTHPVRLTTADGVPLAIEVPDGTSVAEAAARSGHVLPGQCGQGTCGSCHAHATGRYTLGPHSPSALPDEEDGGVLLCRTYADGPVEITTDYPRSRIIDGAPGRREGHVTEVVQVADATVLVRVQLAPDEQVGTGFELEPGQFVEVEIPGDPRRRAYSPASTSSWDGTAELVIRLHPGGYLSGILRDILDGSRPVEQPLVVHGPMGAFGIRESGLRPRWFVAGGTGLAPVLSILRRMVEWAEPHPARLFFGVTTPGDLPSLPALEALRGAVSIEQCVWQPDETWAGATGTPVDLLVEALAAHEGSTPDVYVAGPPALVDAVRAAVDGAGFAPEHVIAERVLPT